MRKHKFLEAFGCCTCLWLFTPLGDSHSDTSQMIFLGTAACCNDMLNILINTSVNLLAHAFSARHSIQACRTACIHFLVLIWWCCETSVKSPAGRLMSGADLPLWVLKQAKNWFRTSGSLASSHRYIISVLLLMSNFECSTCIVMEYIFHCGISTFPHVKYLCTSSTTDKQYIKGIHN